MRLRSGRQGCSPRFASRINGRLDSCESPDARAALPQELLIHENKVWFGELEMARMCQNQSANVPQSLDIGR